MLKVGFLINPIAGMGGRVGLKGTDGMEKKARALGAKEISLFRAKEFLESFHSDRVKFLVPSGKMGEDLVKTYSISYNVIYSIPSETTSNDTKLVCSMFLEKNVDIILFVGGDGTARDVVSSVSYRVPVLGIPSGVKMYSSVFCITPKLCAEILTAFIQGNAKLIDREVLDIDEQAYRNNKLRIKLYGYAKVPYIPYLIQSSKSEYGTEDEDEKELIAEFFSENMDRNTLYIFGAGTTTAAIARSLGMKKTLLGIDAFHRGKIIAYDLNEKEILELIGKYNEIRVVITPIGSQGFIFGRGNQQLSGNVLRKIGRDKIEIVATPTKLQGIEKLLVDVEGGDFLKGYYRVLVGYGRYKMMKVE